MKTEPGRSANSLRPLHSEWGLSLFLEPQRGDHKRTFLLDFGWTPEAINGNMELLKVDPSKIDALIMSHGHFDHLGGLMGFLDKHRKSMPADLTMYAGGEDNFCQRYVAPARAGDLSDFGMLDRRDLAKRDVKVMLCETPTVIGDAGLHHRQDQAQLDREGAAEHAGRVQAQGRRRLQLEPLFAGRNGRQDRARRAYPRARDLLQPEGQGPRSSSLPAAMSASSIRCGRRWKSPASTRCMPSWAASISGRRRPDYLTQVVAEIGKLNPDVRDPHALQRAQLHPGSAAADAGQGADHHDRHPHHLRHLIGSERRRFWQG